MIIMIISFNDVEHLNLTYPVMNFNAAPTSSIHGTSTALHAGVVSHTLLASCIMLASTSKATPKSCMHCYCPVGTHTRLSVPTVMLHS
jgi:hypothetical protein